ncbi:MAG: hypothetical protein R3211_03785 [Balneolaceae bacterium]|nr:hypothetical protein [Balneolaceae bacterium]
MKSEQNGTTENEGTFITIPVMVNHLSGTGNHHLELGGGITIITFSENDPDEDLLDLSSGSAVAATATVGYRYQKPEGGFLFKIGFTPLTNFDVFLPWGGISLGYAF